MIIVPLHQPRLRGIASAMAGKARKYILRSYFSGFPQRDDLEIVEEELPPIKDGGALILLSLFSVGAGFLRLAPLRTRLQL